MQIKSKTNSNTIWFGISKSPTSPQYPIIRSTPNEANAIHVQELRRAAQEFSARERERRSAEVPEHVRVLQTGRPVEQNGRLQEHSDLNSFKANSVLRGGSRVLPGGRWGNWPVRAKLWLELWHFAGKLEEDQGGRGNLKDVRIVWWYYISKYKLINHQITCIY